MVQVLVLVFHEHKPLNTVTKFNRLNKKIQLKKLKQKGSELIHEIKKQNKPFCPLCEFY